MALERRRVRLRGRVQGVGFRPSVWHLARDCGVSGWVRNGVDGVTLEAEGPSATLDDFLNRVEAMPSPARIERFASEPCEVEGGSGFVVRASELEGEPALVLLPDLVVCEDCLREVLDPRDRRHRYPFTSCAVCGPRYSVVEALPWDRERTSMRHFPLCPACRAEYENPEDRRFHAETIACVDCGPRLMLSDPSADAIARDDQALLAAAHALRRGEVVALKGLGGYQLLCDARSSAAVARLRERKVRPDKPLALMARDLSKVAELAEATALERELLASRSGPIVLLRRRRDAGVAPEIAPGLAWFGVMLPTTPLHHLLLAEFKGPVVATSGNRSGEPLFADDDEARDGLGGIADLFLGHDRPVVNPLDDSVVRVVGGRELTLRCARGLAPLTLPAPFVLPPIVALGGDLKAAVALGAGAEIILGPHIGDLESPRSQAAAESSWARLSQLGGGSDRSLAVDAHPDWFAGHLARRRVDDVIPVMHHHAHVLSCLAENGECGPVLGVAWDGTGYGGDGSIRGGELLLVDGPRCRRLGHLGSFRLPGGDRAVREPRRSMLGLLFEVLGPKGIGAAEVERAFRAEEISVLSRMIETGRLAPVTTSAGRLLDGLAALLGLRNLASFEGQAAMELESLAVDQDWSSLTLPDDYRLVIDAGVLDWGQLLNSIRRDRDSGLPVSLLAALIHEALALGIAEAASGLLPVGVTTVALTGGCFQNAVLTERALHHLRARGLRCLRHGRVPPNDGGLALGQVLAAAWSRRF